eukprot:COSAG02_NODE_4418_length_5382_cov_23.288283_3_plen_695_part_00
MKGARAARQQKLARQKQKAPTAEALPPEAPAAARITWAKALLARLEGGSGAAASGGGMSTGGGGMGMGMGMSGGGGGDTAPTPVVAPVVVQQPLRWKQPLSSAGMTFSGGDTAVTVTVEASSMHRAACVTLGRDGGTVAVLATMPAGYKRRNDFSFGVGRLDSMRNLGQFGKTSNTCGLHQNSHLDWGPLPPGWRLWSLGTGTGQHWEKPFARLEDRKYTELDDNAAFAALDEGALDFIAAPNFQGARKGYSFSTRGHRTGYFRDAGPASAAGAGRFQVAGGNGMLEGGIMRLALNLSARGVDGTRTARFFRDGLEVAVFVDIKDDGSDSEWLAGVTLDTNGSARLMQAEGEELVPFVTEADMVEYELCRARQRLAFAMHGETPGIQAGLPYNVVQQVSAALPLPSLKVVLATAAQVVVIPTVAEAARVAEEAAAVRAALEKAVAEKADADRILASIASDKEAIARWLSNPSPTGQAEIAALNKKYYGMAPRAKLEELAVKYIAEEISAEEGTPPIDAESPEPVVEPTAEAPAPTPPEQLPRAAKAAPERLPQNATEWRQAQAKQVAIEQAAKASCTQVRLLSCGQLFSSGPFGAFSCLLRTYCVQTMGSSLSWARDRLLKVRYAMCSRTACSCGWPLRRTMCQGRFRCWTKGRQLTGSGMKRTRCYMVGQPYSRHAITAHQRWRRSSWAVART